jgi:hypothetical protein
MSGQEKKNWNLYELMEEKSKHVEKALASSGAKDAQKEAKALIHEAWQEAAGEMTRNFRIFCVGVAVGSAAVSALWLRDDPTASVDNIVSIAATVVMGGFGTAVDSSWYMPRAKNGYEPQPGDTGAKDVYKKAQKKIAKKVAQKFNLG